MISRTLFRLGFILFLGVAMSYGLASIWTWYAYSQNLSGTLGGY